jgi:hypothetical protein
VLLRRVFVSGIDRLPQITFATQHEIVRPKVTQYHQYHSTEETGLGPGNTLLRRTNLRHSLDGTAAGTCDGGTAGDAPVI